MKVWLNLVLISIILLMLCPMVLAANQPMDNEGLVDGYIDTIYTVAKTIGIIMANFTQFIINIVNGWTLILAVMTVGSILIIYFRFFRKQIDFVMED